MRSYFQQSNAPKSLKLLLWTIVSLSLICAVFNKLALTYFSGISIEGILGLTKYALHGFFWQPLTYLFISPSPEGFTFSFMLNLFFDCYMLWSIGSLLLQQLGKRSFFSFYFITGILSGILASVLMGSVGSHTILLGPLPAINAVLIAWMMIFPGADLTLFFAIRMKTEWLVSAFLGISLLSALSDGDLIKAALIVIGAVIAYLYTTVVWGLRSPFKWTQKLDRGLGLIGSVIRKAVSRKKHRSEKIVDIRQK